MAVSWLVPVMASVLVVLGPSAYSFANGRRLGSGCSRLTPPPPPSLQGPSTLVPCSSFDPGPISLWSQVPLKAANPWRRNRIGTFICSDAFSLSPTVSEVQHRGVGNSARKPWLPWRLRASWPVPAL